MKKCVWLGVVLLTMGLLLTAQGVASAAEYKEAPMLAELVKAGKLPPVEERLPKNPFVVGPDKLILEEHMPFTIGQYGGTLRMPMQRPNGDPHIYLGMIEPFVWAPEGFFFDKGVMGNVAETFEVNDDDTVFTLKLREGLKWSDGVEVTTEDVRFGYEDILMNEEVTPAIATWLRTGNSGSGSPLTIEIVDTYTFRIKFDGPYGAFPSMLGISGWRAYSELMVPSHYAKQFHAKYTPMETLAPLMKEASIPEGEWWTLFNSRVIRYNVMAAQQEAYLGHPTLLPWVLTKVDGNFRTFERNPYYFKVDPDGQQLPYIDTIQAEVVTDRETLTMRTIMGEFDYIGERASLKKLPLMKENEAAGNIKVHIPRMHRLPIAFMLQLTYDEPGSVFRQVTGDARFRKALSLAINRQEILDTFYLGMFAEMPTTLTDPEFNVDKANALLDEMGLEKKDADGFRLGPDGNRFEIRFDIGTNSDDHIPMAELIAEYFKEVGVYTMIKQGDWNSIRAQFHANETMAQGLWAHSEIWPSGGWLDYLPNNYWGKLWDLWETSDGASGEEPPAEIKELYNLHKQFMAARIGSPESQAVLEKITQSYRDNYWNFIVAEHSYYPSATAASIQNVPEGMYEGFGIMVNYSMEQWYHAK